MAKISCLSIFQAILSIINLVIFILCLIWLFKIKNNSKNEPEKRDSYIYEDPLNYYIEGDFCYDKSLVYLDKGAFNVFDLRMKKIKKYSKALIVIYVITIILTVITMIFNVLSITKLKYKEKCVSIIYLLLLIIIVIIAILNLVYFIILSAHYFKGKFDDFEDFSDCKFLTTNFKSDYHFVSVVKDNFIKFFILNIISIALSCVKNIIGTIAKKKN